VHLNLKIIFPPIFSGLWQTLLPLN